MNIKLVKSLRPGTLVIVAGMIEELKKALTRRNEPMLFLKLADFTDSIETVIFPRLLASNGSIFRDGECIVMKGTVSDRNGEISIIGKETRILGEKDENKKENVLAG